MYESKNEKKVDVKAEGQENKIWKILEFEISTCDSTRRERKLFKRNFLATNVFKRKGNENFKNYK